MKRAAVAAFAQVQSAAFDCFPRCWWWLPLPPQPPPHNYTIHLNVCVFTCEVLAHKRLGSLVHCHRATLIKPPQNTNTHTGRTHSRRTLALKTPTMMMHIHAMAVHGVHRHRRAIILAAAVAADDDDAATTAVHRRWQSSNRCVQRRTKPPKEAD